MMYAPNAAGVAYHIGKLVAISANRGVDADRRR